MSEPGRMTDAAFAELCGLGIYAFASPEKDVLCAEAARARREEVSQAAENERLTATLAKARLTVSEWTHGPDCSFSDDDAAPECDCGLVELLAVLMPADGGDPGADFLARFRALKARLDAIHLLGAQMAAACFNLSQPERGPLTDADRTSLKALQRQWDALRACP